MAVSQKELKAKIKDILNGADLEQITSKLVRRQLEDHFQKSLSNQRKEIDEIIMRTLNDEKSAESDISSADEKDNDVSSDSSLNMSPPPPVHTNNKSAKSSTSATTSAKTKSRKNVQLTDEELARQLHASENGMRVRRCRNMSLLPWYAQRGAKKRSASPNGSDEAKPPKKMRPPKLCLLNGNLANLMGEDRMTRTDVVKRLWEIAKERQMFDPRDRRFIICDEQFKAVFNRQRIKMFMAMKYLTNHIRNIEDV